MEHVIQRTIDFRPVLEGSFLKISPRDLADAEDEQWPDKAFGIDFIQKLGASRPRWLPTSEAINRVASLLEDMPHMFEFFDEVLTTMRLCERFEANRFTMPPMIINGPPGVGKSHAIFALSEALGISTSTIPMATVTARFALTGMERGWKDPQPGLLAKAAKNSDHINPIFVLDEFEKADFRSLGNTGGLETVFLEILERDSSRRFHEVYLEKELDLSEISFIGASNEIDRVPAALRSRVKQINVGYPEPESLVKMVKSILSKALRDDYGIDCITVDASEDVVEVFCGDFSPRTLRNNAGRILSPFVMKAEAGDCIQVSSKDLLGRCDSTDSVENRGIGFMAKF
ncbi:AAA family ATPase [Zhongshania borealis]|uniref:AAA+ ATPase domain-containing protein n=1 Tax=Zhongshania borealis TaxID=889488 RepID=A0ABP7W7W8_9GAMM